jgi:hypothetical protein
MYVTVARTSAPTASNMYGQVTAYNAFTSQVTINITNVVGSGTFTDWTIAIAPPGLAAFSFTGATTIAVNSTSDALRVTQTGTGNALVVEDSANPDGFPFVIDASGNVNIGVVASYTNAKLNVVSVGSEGPVMLTRASADVVGAELYLRKIRQSNPYVNTIVQSGDGLGSVVFLGNDGANQIRAAQISSFVDGTPGTNDMPGRLVFSTTADGASIPTERMRIDNAGRIGIARTPADNGTLLVSGSPVNNFSYNVQSTPTYGNTVMAEGVGYIATVNTAAAAFTLNAVQNFRVAQGTKGAGSIITNLFGFHCDNLTNGGSNFGFYSTVAAAAGRYNFYAAGTAANFFQGTVATGTSLSVGTSTQNWVHTVYENGNAFTQYINSVSGTANTDGLLVGLTSSDAVVRNRESGNVFLYTADTIRFTVTSTGNLHGTSGTTAMTDGFFYIPSAAGAPSGVPTAITGRVPMYYDTTNNNFYIYNGAWKKVLLA